MKGKGCRRSSEEDSGEDSLEDDRRGGRQVQDREFMRLGELEKLLRRFEAHELKGRCRDLETIMVWVKALLASREMCDMLETLLKVSTFSNAVFKTITSRLHLW